MIFLTLAINCSRIYLENISARSNMCTDLSFSQYHHQSGEINLTMTLQYHQSGEINC
jgi:hypothetical protein